MRYNGAHLCRWSDIQVQDIQKLNYHYREDQLKRADNRNHL